MHETEIFVRVSERRFKLRSEDGFVYLTNNPNIQNHALNNYYCRIQFILIIRKILYTNPNIRYTVLQISLRYI